MRKIAKARGYMGLPVNASLLSAKARTRPIERRQDT
jgi:hypothetical protein